MAQLNREVMELWLTCGHRVTGANPQVNTRGELMVFCRRCISNKVVVKAVPTWQVATERLKF